MGNEIFKVIPNCNSKYLVSNLGRIKSNHTGKMLKQTEDRSCGYLQVTIRIGGKITKVRTHVAVAIAFLGHKPDGFNIIVDHKDNNKLNNNEGNLQLVSNRLNSTKDIDKSKTTSKYTGVSWNKSMSKWLVTIRAFGKSHYLGYYVDEDFAGEVYQHAKMEIVTTDSFNKIRFKEKYYGKG